MALATLFGDNETLKDKLQAVQNRVARTTVKNEICFQFFVCLEVTLYKHVCHKNCPEQRLKMARPIIGAETVLASPPKCKSYKRLHLGVEINQLA